MFGLMRSRSSCSQSREERLRRRLHYCGTCKTIGRLYGQRPRALLNFDVVFAAELLTALSGSDVAAWDAAYRSVNCLRLPSETALAPELRYAAAVNVVLAEIKVNDAIEDGGSRAWRLARAAFSTSFRRAAADLEALGLDVDALRACVAGQAATERALAGSAELSPNASLLEAERATAEATALVFERGAAVAGAPSARDDLRAFGRAFGALVYTIDALRDVADDARSGAFNAVSAAFNINGDRLPPDVRAEVIRRARGLAAEAEAALRRLPIPAERAARFADRLSANLARVGVVRRLPVRAATKCAPTTAAARRAAAVSVARSLVASRSASCRPLPLRVVEAPFVVAVGAFAGFVAPHLAGRAPSLGACVDASLSLAAVGSAVVAMAVPPPLPPGPIDPTRPRGKAGPAGQSGGGEGGDSDCFDCGDCCDCCECSCETCDCAVCSCESCSCCESAECCGGCGDCCGACDCSCDC